MGKMVSWPWNSKKQTNRNAATLHCLIVLDNGHYFSPWVSHKPNTGENSWMSGKWGFFFQYLSTLMWAFLKDGEKTWSILNCLSIYIVIIPMSGEKEMRNPQFLESHALEYFAGCLCIHYPARRSQSSLEVISRNGRTLFHRQGIRFS